MTIDRVVIKGVLGLFGIGLLGVLPAVGLVRLIRRGSGLAVAALSFLLGL